MKELYKLFNWGATRPEFTDGEARLLASVVVTEAMDGIEAAWEELTEGWEDAPGIITDEDTLTAVADIIEGRYCGDPVQIDAGAEYLRSRGLEPILQAAMERIPF